jgi:predicted nucleic acid-binding protein
MIPEKVIVDANVAFKSLCSGRGHLRSKLTPISNRQLFSPRYVLVELFKPKERIARASGLRENELLEAFYVLLAQIDFVNEGVIPIGTWVEAYRLCRGIDEKDTAYVALTLYLDGLFWTEDKLVPKSFAALLSLRN